MRILQVNVVGASGSTGRIVQSLLRSLRERGHEGRIACGRDVPADGMAIGGRADVLRHVALTRLSDRHGYGSRGATLAFLRQAEAYEPDLIHLHNIHGYYLHVGELFSWLKRSGVPVVWTLHDCWAFTGHCAYFDYAGCARWQEGCRDCPQRGAYPTSLFLDRSAANWRDKRECFNGLPHLTLVTPSRWLAGLAGRSFLKGVPCRVIPNGVDTAVFQPRPGRERVRRQMGISDGKRLYLAAANVWEPRKGLAFLREMLPRLQADETLAVLGLENGRLPAPALCLPRVERVEELAELYGASDAFLNPTLEDNLPTVNLEALACGTPVATFASGGSPETVDAGIGRVCERGDAAGLLAAARELAHGGEAVRAACARRAAALYDASRQSAAYVELYEEILRDTRRT